MFSVFATICSDAPALLGEGAPRLTDIKSLGGHANLAHWGRRRAPVCKERLEGVFKNLDRNGVWKVACGESVVSLLMAAKLIAYTGGSLPTLLCE